MNILKGNASEGIDVKDLLFKTPISDVHNYFSSTGVLANVKGMWVGNDKKIIKKRNKLRPHTVGVSCFQEVYLNLIVTFYFSDFDLGITISKFDGNICNITIDYCELDSRFTYTKVDQNKTLADYIKETENRDDDSGVS